MSLMVINHGRVHKKSPEKQPQDKKKANTADMLTWYRFRQGVWLISFLRLRPIHVNWVWSTLKVRSSTSKGACVLYIILVILLMAEILHQLIGSLSHDLQGLYIPGGAGFLPSTVVLCIIKMLAFPHTPWIPSHVPGWYSGTLTWGESNGTNCEKILKMLPLESFLSLEWPSIKNPQQKQGFNRLLFVGKLILNKTLSGWWFQPIWKICSSNWKSSPNFGAKIKKYLSCHQI